MYALLIRELISDVHEQDRLFAALSTMPAVTAKAEWCIRWIASSTTDFATRLAAFAIVEGVFFSSSFAAIFWFRSRGLLPGLCTSNELIARDEGMHTSFACLLWHHLDHRTPREVVELMIVEAVKLEQDFFECMWRDITFNPVTADAFLHAAALPHPLGAMSAFTMRKYVEYVGDFLLSKLGFPPYFKTLNPVSTCRSVSDRH